MQVLILLLITLFRSLIRHAELSLHLLQDWLIFVFVEEISLSYLLSASRHLVWGLLAVLFELTDGLVTWHFKSVLEDFVLHNKALVEDLAEFQDEFIK